MPAPSEGRIDVHTHGLPQDFPRLGQRYGGDWPELTVESTCAGTITVGGRHFRDIDQRCWDAASRLEQMDEDGVGLQVVSPIPVTMSYHLPAAGVRELARAQNDWLASMASEHPDRFAGFGTVPFQDPDAAVEIADEALVGLGLSGIEIATNVDGRPLDDPAYDQVFAAVAERGGVVFVHPWQMLGRERLNRYGLLQSVGMGAETAQAAARLILGGVLDRYPGLQVLLSHGGGGFPALLPRISTFARIAAGAGNEPDPPVTDYAQRFFYDSCVFSTQHLRWLLELVGADRLVVGTDYPFAVAERPAGAVVDRAELDPAIKQQLLRDNAVGLLGRAAGDHPPSSATP